MASTGKKKTTMAKLNRESKLRERRAEKEARKRLRKLDAAHALSQPEGFSTEGQESPDVPPVPGIASSDSGEQGMKSTAAA
jgi:hypothetical protein